ncbi:pseudouridine synthase [Parapedobacter deserti]|uniref:Pseudouridine synthase n=1 Tax=Parapedobacter deserti TaxID=1912957 RepID=A0ABV7JKU2_9SPHI
MPFSNKRNSRDDKSKRFSKPTTDHSPSRSHKSGNRNKPDERRPADQRSGDDRERKYGSGTKPTYGSAKRRNVEGSGQADDNRRRTDSQSGDNRERKYGAGKRAHFGTDKRPFDNKRSDRPSSWKPRDRRADAPKPSTRMPEEDGLIRLNRYIANSGICSRRKADELIQAGVVTVNGNVVNELGVKVDPSKDEIRYNGERLKREKMVYVLLNKPKDYITTTDDPQERRTVMQLVAKATKERIYPVGRLDRNTTGLLLLTNDGNLAEKLSHPRNNVVKLYNVELDKNLNQGDFNKIAFGLELEDGFVKPDAISYVQGGSKREIGVQIHSGKNRIVRRIFEHLGYNVVKLDRVVYANLTKKDLTRGRWRYLEEKEIIQLKHFIK